jgi:hypothetical protein
MKPYDELLSTAVFTWWNNGDEEKLLRLRDRYTPQEHAGEQACKHSAMAAVAWMALVYRRNCHINEALHNEKLLDTYFKEHGV